MDSGEHTHTEPQFDIESNYVGEVSALLPQTETRRPSDVDEGTLKNMIYLACASLFIGTSLYSFLVPWLPGIIAEDELSYIEVVFLICSYAVGVLFGILAGKVRCWQLLVLSQGLLFLSALTFSVSDSFLPTFLARGIVGFASMSLKSSVFSLIESTSLSTNFPSRTAAIASSAGGLLFGPIIGAAFESNVVAIFCAVALPFIAFLSYKLGEQVPFDVQKTTSLVLLFRDFNSSFPLFCVAQAAAATTFVILFLSDIVIERLRISDAALAAICAIFIMCFALSSNLSSLIASRHPLNVVISISLIATGVLPIFFAFPHSLFALEPLLILFPAASALLFVFAASSLSQDIEPLQLYIAVSVAQAVGSLLGGTVAIVSDLFVSPENTAYLAGLILSCISVGAAYFGRAHTKEIALNVNSGLIDFPVMFAF